MNGASGQSFKVQPHSLLLRQSGIFCRHISKMTRIVIAAIVVNAQECRNTLPERSEILQFRLCPHCFGKCRNARKLHILHLLEIGDILGPQVSLRTTHELSFLAGELLGNRFKLIDLLHRNISANGKRLILHVFSLIIVEI